jgi:hypothetical protein
MRAGRLDGLKGRIAGGGILSEPSSRSGITSTTPATVHKRNNCQFQQCYPTKGNLTLNLWCCYVPNVPCFGLPFSDPDFGDYQSGFVVAEHAVISIQGQHASRCPKCSYEELRTNNGRSFYFWKGCAYFSAADHVCDFQRANESSHSSGVGRFGALHPAHPNRGAVVFANQ